MKSLSAIIAVLADPKVVIHFSDNDWSELLSQGYHTNLLARLCYFFKESGVIESVPATIQWHFESAYRMSVAHARDVNIEIEKINFALKQGGITPVFLKGAAYELAGDRVSFGRVYSDVDIFVPKQEIEAAEYILKLHGWKSSQMDPYDQEYYRRWMHEIPPLYHRGRGTTLDVHHNLLPLTCRIRIDSSKLIKSRDALQTQVLKMEDRLLHAVVHLFMEGEFDKGLRDLSDIDLLIRQHCLGESDWVEVSKRAADLGVGRLWYYALVSCQIIFHTLIPVKVLEDCRKDYALPKPFNGIMLSLFTVIFTVSPALSIGRKYNFAHIIMYLRGHWLRMPLKLLIPHLLKKSLRKSEEKVQPVN